MRMKAMKIKKLIVICSHFSQIRDFKLCDLEFGDIIHFLQPHLDVIFQYN